MFSRNGIEASRYDLVNGTVVGSTSFEPFPLVWRIVYALQSENLGPPPARRRTVYDFTGDGMSDLVWRNAAGTLAFWVVDIRAGGTSGRYILGTVDPSWEIAAVGDYTGDRTSDILFRHRPTGAIGYWRIFRGSIVEFVPLRWDLGLEWQVVSSRKRSEFDGDGRDDILLRHSSGALGMYLLTGDAPFQIRWVDIGPVDPEWSVQGTADFNGDGREDILFRHRSTGAVRYARMGGGGIEGWVELIASLDAQWIVGTLADFNGDGFDDIYWLTSSIQTEGYWDMRGGQLTAFRPNTAVRSLHALSLRFLSSGDYAGDRSEDILFSLSTSRSAGHVYPFVDGVDGASFLFVSNRDFVWSDGR